MRPRLFGDGGRRTGNTRRARVTAPPFPAFAKGCEAQPSDPYCPATGFFHPCHSAGLENLGKLKLPCVLHWDLNHFVGLAKVGESKVTILALNSGIGCINLQRRSPSRFIGEWRWLARQSLPPTTSPIP